ncbi:15624_t:CDS:10, partial [Dentiscutata erythropus]
MYELPDSLKQKLDSYFLSDDASSLSNWNNWSFISFLEFTKKRRALSIKNKRDLHQRFSNSLNAILMSDAPREVKEVTKALQGEMYSTSVDLFWKEVQTSEEIAVAQAEYQRKQAFIELKKWRVIESREREVEKDVNVIIIADMKALSVTTTSLYSHNTAIPPRNALQPLSQDASTTTPPPVNTSTALPPRYTLTTPPGNASIAPPPRYTFTTPPRNAPPPLSQNIFKRFLDIYETSFEMDWAPWKFDITINNVNIECVLMSLHEKCQKTKPKTTSLEYGIIDLNDGIILEALGQSVISHFEAKMQEYKPKKALSAEVIRILKTFNVTSLEDLGKALDDVKIDYNNLDRDIIYLRRLFEKLDLPEGWYNSHIVAPIFDDCLESMDECILRRGEVESFVQKLLEKKSRKRKKYDGILSFSRQFEFIYVETATTSVLSKSDKDLSKLHNAIILMFKHMVSTLPEKLLHEISSMPILCVQFSGASVEIYLAIWLTNMRPVVFSIMDFEIAEEITTFPKMTKVAAKMLFLRPFIQNLHKRYQTLLTKEADYYLDDNNTWTSPMRMKA